MGGVKTIAAVFCSVAVLSGGLQVLGMGKMGKALGYILSLIMLTSMVAALSKADFSFEIKEADSSRIENDTSLSLSSYQAEYISGALLIENGIKYEKIEALATKTDDGSIIISKIIIKGASRPEKAEKIILDSSITDVVQTE